MASESTEDKKTEVEPPLQEETKLEEKQESKEQNGPGDEKAEKEEIDTRNQEVAEEKEVNTATGAPEGVNVDAKGEGSKQVGEQEIPEVAEEHETGADDEPEDKNADKKREDSIEEEDEGENEGESEGDGKSEDEGEGSEEAKKGQEGNANKEKTEPMKRRRNSGEKKGKKDSNLKEPVTPSIERPARERKTVERYSVPSPGRFGRSSASKSLSIEKGRGTKLMDIPNVAFKLSKRKADDNLQLLHTILFGKKAKAQTLKRNISQFSGYVWVENEQDKHRSRVKEKLEKCVKEKLMDFCDVLNIPINKASVKKEELSAKLLEFLESPHATTDVLLAEKEQKGKKRRRVTPGKIIVSGESTDVPAKKQKSQSGRKRKHASEVEEEDDDKVETSNENDGSRNDSGGDDDDDDVTPHKEEIDEKNSSDEEDKSPEKMSSPNRSSKKAGKGDLGSKYTEKASSSKKASVKTAKDAAKSTKKMSSTSKKGDAAKSTGSPSKSKGRSKKLKVEENKPAKEKSSSRKQTSKLPAKGSVEEQGKGKHSKKVKREPSRDEMHAVVVNILKQVDFNTATLSDILRQLGTHFGVDLMHRKAEVKDIITDVINNMSDEEEEAEDEGGASDGSDKDEDDA